MPCAESILSLEPVARRVSSSLALLSSQASAAAVSGRLGAALDFRRRLRRLRAGRPHYLGLLRLLRARPFPGLRAIAAKDAEDLHHKVKDSMGLSDKLKETEDELAARREDSRAALRWLDSGECRKSLPRLRTLEISLVGVLTAMDAFESLRLLRLAGPSTESLGVAGDLKRPDVLIKAEVVSALREALRGGWVGRLSVLGHPHWTEAVLLELAFSDSLGRIGSLATTGLRLPDETEGGADFGLDRLAPHLRRLRLRSASRLNFGPASQISSVRLRRHETNSYGSLAGLLGSLAQLAGLRRLELSTTSLQLPMTQLSQLTGLRTLVIAVTCSKALHSPLHAHLPPGLERLSVTASDSSARLYVCPNKRPLPPKTRLVNCFRDVAKQPLLVTAQMTRFYGHEKVDEACDVYKVSVGVW